MSDFIFIFFLFFKKFEHARGRKGVRPANDLLIVYSFNSAYRADCNE